MKKQTAVEWLKLQLETYGDPQYCELTWKELDELCEQANKMLEEQMEKTFKQAQECAVKADGVYFKYESFEQYYNETYKGGKK